MSSVLWAVQASSAIENAMLKISLKQGLSNIIELSDCKSQLAQVPLPISLEKALMQSRL